jgi:hypothetical protein
VNPAQINEARDWIRSAHPNLEQIEQRADAEKHRRYSLGSLTGAATFSIPDENLLRQEFGLVAHESLR